MNTPKLVPGLDFSLTTWVTKAENGIDEQYPINDLATVRYRIVSADERTALTSWVTQTKNENPYSFWGIGRVHVVIPAVDTTAISATGSAKLQVLIQGEELDRDLALTGRNYERSYTEVISISTPLAA